MSEKILEAVVIGSGFGGAISACRLSMKWPGAGVEFCRAIWARIRLPLLCYVRGAQLSSQPLSSILKPIALDPLTVADDKTFLDDMEHQPNVPLAIRDGIRSLY